MNLMAESMKVVLSDALKMVGIVPDAMAESEVPQASWDLYEMIQAFMQAPSYHVIFEVVLVMWIIRLLFFTKSYKPERTVLTEQEKEELIEEWIPEPLVPDIDENHPVLQNMENRLVSGKIGKYVTINGSECLNMASLNFLGMSGRKDIEEMAVKSLRKYGVGSCGPRGFYGTVDVHLKLEEKLEHFMQTEEAIVYSYGFATIASAIPAYSKRGDVIFVDEGVHFAIQKGIQASRSKVYYFKHNSLEDLERVLKLQQVEDKKNPKKAKVTRRFMVIEGLYVNYGDICPLPQMVELKHKYKVRIFMDETVSFGTLGKTGKGVTEHFGIPIDEIDLIAGSLENAIASVGGFCCGKAFVIDHQRLSGLGYCFSASAPPMLAQAAITALEVLEDSPDLLETLHDLSEYTHSKLQQLSGLRIAGDAISPVKHLYLAASSGDREKDLSKLRRIVAKAEDNGIALTVAAYLDEEIHMPEPSLRIPVNAALKYEDVDRFTEVLRTVLNEVL